MATHSTSAAPTPAGGTLSAGTYDLTSVTLHSALAADGGRPTEFPRRETVVLTGTGNNFTVQTAQVSGTTVERQNGTLTATGTQATFAQTCPPPGDGGDDGGGTFGYTVGTMTFTIIEATGSSTGAIRVAVYTQRP
jgi:hypothetical protein